MHCQNCQKELKEDAKFCIQCGHPVPGKETEVTAETAAGSQFAQASHSQQAGTRRQETNEYIEKGTEILKDYWRFFVRNLKAPSFEGEQASRNWLIHSCINIFLFALFVGLGFYLLLERFDSAFSMFGVNVSFGTFFTMFVYIIASSLVSTAVLFGIVRLIMKADVQFDGVLTRFGTLTTIPVALSVLYLLCSMVGLISFAAFVSIFILIALAVVSVLTLFSYRKADQGTVDPFYGLLIFYLVLFIFFWITRGILPRMFIGSLF